MSDEQSQPFGFQVFPILETPRLRLRQLTPADVSAILKHFGNAQVVQFIEMQPIKTLEQANEWLKWMGDFYAAQDGLRWAIETRSDLAFIGSAGLHHWEREHHCAELGFDITQDYWGEGYATEVARALIEFAWQHMHLNRLQADVMQGNRASMRVLEKLGFQREGLLRQRVRKGGKYYDVYLFGLLRSDYTPPTNS